MIISEPCAGLGNRFLGLASCYYWAKENNEKLKVLWKTETAMGARHDVIFSLPDEIEVIQAKDYGYKVYPFSQMRYDILKKRFKASADFFADVGEVKDLYDAKGKEGIADVIKNNDTKYLRVFTEFYPLSEIENPLGFIKPTDAVLKRVYDTIGDADKSNIIGIHIRRSDNKVCINNSPIELFINKMKEEVEADDKIKFYLASDDKAILDEFTKIFGNRILIMKDKSFARDNADGIIDAYAELLCLSHSQKIIGSFYSSYSKIAAMISGIPLEIMRIENLIPW